ncbi:serine/threonine-protein phosphatase 6 regulatory ankyrin repeat subunit B-like [Amphibalanus amphitrite]|uniref:serine/threonine-protein phosphatase 6 regulatory ankyrin repeat subunit B-like n=1 Tax=Amphibalanus amphitrite TaxID=1232801 RepID=UPI001C910E3A|nr:serine/threonine-protein phosphatase 6 regulatory ankyrin repeat subunit B-like [Amphibalanus amphitrite]
MASDSDGDDRKTWADGRTALHLSAASSDPRGTYDALVRAGADEKTRDKRGRPAQYYLDHPDDLALPTKAEPTTGGSGSGPVSHATIRIWIHGRDLNKLEQMVLDGHGERLLNETAGSNRVNKFLTSVRPLMIRIRELHSAAINGDSAKVEAMTEGQSRLLTSKDQNGLTILHKAATLGHRTIVETSLGTVRDQKDEPDNDGYTPLFYAAASQNKEIYDLLVKAGADVNRVDKRKKTAEHYREHPKEMPMQHVYQLPDAPRNSGDSLGVPDGPNRRRSVSTDRHQGGDGGQAAKGKRSTSRRETVSVRVYSY